MRKGFIIFTFSFHHNITRLNHFRVFKRFKLKTMGDYTSLYCIVDCLLLMDIMANFRELCMDIYGLDIHHFLTLPAFSWCACLKMTKARLELITDVDMLQFVDRVLKGGLCLKFHIQTILF